MIGRIAVCMSYSFVIHMIVRLTYHPTENSVGCDKMVGLWLFTVGWTSTISLVSSLVSLGFSYSSIPLQLLLSGISAWDVLAVRDTVAQ